MSYEKNQAYMQKLMQECLSDEDPEVDPYESDASNDEYKPGSNEEYSDSSYEHRQPDFMWASTLDIIV